MTLLSCSSSKLTQPPPKAMSYFGLPSSAQLPSAMQTSFLWSALSSYFSTDGSDIAKAAKICIQLIRQILLFRPDSHQVWERSTEVQEAEGLWLAVELPRRRVYQETQLFLILNQHFLWFQQWFSRYCGVHNLTCSKHAGQSCYFPPRPVITLGNSFICGIFTYNSHNLYFFLLAYKYHLKWFSHQ